MFNYNCFKPLHCASHLPVKRLISQQSTVSSKSSLSHKLLGYGLEHDAFKLPKLSLIHALNSLSIMGVSSDDLIGFSKQLQHHGLVDTGGYALPCVSNQQSIDRILCDYPSLIPMKQMLKGFFEFTHYNKYDVSHVWDAPYGKERFILKNNNPDQMCMTAFLCADALNKGRLPLFLQSKSEHFFLNRDIHQTNRVYYHEKEFHRLSFLYINNNLASQQKLIQDMNVLFKQTRSEELHVLLFKQKQSGDREFPLWTYQSSSNRLNPFDSGHVDRVTTSRLLNHFPPSGIAITGKSFDEYTQKIIKKTYQQIVSIDSSDFLPDSRIMMMPSKQGALVCIVPKEIKRDDIKKLQDASLHVIVDELNEVGLMSEIRNQASSSLISKPITSAEWQLTTCRLEQDPLPDLLLESVSQIMRDMNKTSPFLGSGPGPDLGPSDPDAFGGLFLSYPNLCRVQEL